MNGSVPTRDEIDDAIHAWHTGSGPGMTLQEYLGWTWDEYKRWAEDVHAVPQRPLRINHAD